MTQLCNTFPMLLMVVTKHAPHFLKQPATCQTQNFPARLPHLKFLTTEVKWPKNRGDRNRWRCIWGHVCGKNGVRCSSFSFLATFCIGRVLQDCGTRFLSAWSHNVKWDDNTIRQGSKLDMQTRRMQRGRSGKDSIAHAPVLQVVNGVVTWYTTQSIKEVHSQLTQRVVYGNAGVQQLHPQQPYRTQLSSSSHKLNVFSRTTKETHPFSFPKWKKGISLAAGYDRVDRVDGCHEFARRCHLRRLCAWVNA